ncbi:MAG: acylhydrolase, partial [Maribacter sp.]
MKIKRFLIMATITSLLGLNKGYAQDWANLKHFQEANNKIGAPATNEDRVVFMGNSITIGWLNSRPEFFKDKP